MVDHFLSIIPQGHVPAVESNYFIIVSREPFEGSDRAANGLLERPFEACFCADRHTDFLGAENYKLPTVEGALDLFYQKDYGGDDHVECLPFLADLNFTASQLFSHLYIRRKFVEIRSKIFNMKRDCQKCEIILERSAWRSRRQSARKSRSVG